ncbi:hypothetical protein [Wolbachia endosymbiont (group A) of Nomada hirtipes]
MIGSLAKEEKTAEAGKTGDQLEKCIGPTSLNHTRQVKEIKV